MNNILDSLNKFKELLNAPKIKKQKILEIINKESNLNLTEENITIDKRIIYIKGSPILKNNIFMKKKGILESLKGEMKELAPIDIR